MTGQEIREVLDGARVFPSKQLGQNFLTDQNMARWIVSQLEISAGDTVVEVGPGPVRSRSMLSGKRSAWFLWSSTDGSQAR